MTVTKEKRNMIRKRGLKSRKERVGKRVESKGQFESRFQMDFSVIMNVKMAPL
jgi:hypothetical protein